MLKNGWPTCPNLAGTGETIQGHGGTSQPWSREHHFYVLDPQDMTIS